jgi:O-antigen ligase
MSPVPQNPVGRRPQLFTGRRDFRSPYDMLMVAALIAVASAFSYRLVFYPESNLMPFMGLAVVLTFIVWRPVIGIALYLFFYPMVPKGASINLVKSVMLGLTVINIGIWVWQKMRVREFIWMRQEYIWIYVFFLYTGLSPFLGIINGFTVMDWARDIAPLLNLLMVPVLAEYFGEKKHRWLLLLVQAPVVFSTIMYLEYYLSVFFGLPRPPGVLYIYQISTFHFGMLFCIGIIMFIQQVKPRWLWLSGGLTAMVTTAMMPTRTIWFSLGFTAAQMLSLNKRFRRLSFALGAAFIIALGWLYFSPAPQFASYRSDRKGNWMAVQTERIYGIKERDLGMLNRVTEFEQAREIFKKSPFVGVGFGYWFTLWQYLVSFTGMSGFWTTNNLHNDVMFFLVKGGILGTLLFAVLLYNLMQRLYLIRKRHRGTALALWPTIAIIAVYNSLFVGSTTAVYQTREAIFFLAVILALGLSAYEMEPGRKDAAS